MKTRTSLIAAAALALLAVPGFSAPLPAGDRGEGGPRHGRLGSRMAEYLDLTAEQQASARQLFLANAEKVRPLREAQRSTREQLRTALDADNPDPAAVGNLVIALHAKGDEIKAARETFRRDFAALLTPEQRQKYDNLKESRGTFGGRRGARGHRGGFGPRGGDR